MLLRCIAVVIVLCVKYFLLRPKVERRPTMPNVALEAGTTDSFTLRNPLKPPNSNYLRLDFHRDGGARGFSSYESSEPRYGFDRVNHLFLDMESGEAKWLLPSLHSVLLHSLIVREKVNVDGNRQPVFSAGPWQARPWPGGNALKYLYVVIESDTNGDGSRNLHDQVALTASDLDGSNYKTLIEDADRIHQMDQVDDGKILVIYEKGGDSFMEILSVPSLERLSQKKVPPIGKAPAPAPAAR